MEAVQEKRLQLQCSEQNHGKSQLHQKITEKLKLYITLLAFDIDYIPLGRMKTNISGL